MSGKLEKEERQWCDWSEGKRLRTRRAGGTPSILAEDPRAKEATGVSPRVKGLTTWSSDVQGQEKEDSFLAQEETETQRFSLPLPFCSTKMLIRRGDSCPEG